MENSAGEVRQQTKTIGELLLSAGLIKKEQLDEALKEQKISGEPLGKILVKKRLVTEKDLMTVLKGMLVVVFETGGELFGFDVVYVKEIVNYKKITAVPNMPGYIKGMISLRNEVIPVISLGMRIFNKAEVFDEETKIIIVEIKEKYSGFIVDRVHAVKNFQNIDFENIGKLLLSLDDKVKCGIIKVNDNLITILNPEILVQEQ